jgi:Skp family chaperone for outer membrane proteins
MRLIRCLALALGLLSTQPALAQLSLGEPVATAGPILTLEKNRIYADSRFGRQTQAKIDADVKTLAAENRNLEAALEAEETALAERRTSMPAAEFQTLAQAFDAKVRDIRQARDAKVRDLSLRQDQQPRRGQQPPPLVPPSPPGRCTEWVASKITGRPSLRIQ